MKRPSAEVMQNYYGVQTECARRQDHNGKYIWTMECPNAGTGLKIAASPENNNWSKTNVSLGEVTEEIKRAKDI